MRKVVPEGKGLSFVPVGVIGIDKNGNIGIKTNASIMPWASVGNEKLTWGAHPDIYDFVAI